ncbi:MAG: ABC-F family ATP-binding cassette domain-containing protein [Defluviimonas sp.]|uniref:ATP-binding cassette domain-containing protein n=1 Tax=Albidovulum sp. TaxID=1872424 RepID=UPI001D6F000D|nr:ABC-F family ATP-binding cassette domain-containing protein [Paracoccaceae bacterium]MCC0063773.1 ABC-F family ATP-binding cassette domain-containing protein [Defluviimonas sp.]
MTLLSLTELGVTIGAPLFSGLTLSLGAGDRLGLVAANGRGKSTLLRLIEGRAEPTEGSVVRARGLKIGHLTQALPEGLAGQTVRDAVLGGLGPEAADYEGWRADVALDALAVPEALQGAQIGTLSGGWQRIVLLARVWVGEPDLLLMDEPTNHLDLGRIGFLERWIAALPRNFPLIVASHDRAFLDRVTNRTLFLRAAGSRDFALPYGRARAALDEVDAAEARRFETEMKAAAQLRRQAAKLKNIGINSGSDLLTVKTRQLSERADRIEEAARPAWRDGSAGRIRLDGAGSHARALVTFEDAVIAAPDGRALYRSGRRWIEPGDRVVVLGANGAGKSRMLAAVAAAVGAEGAVAGVRLAPSAVLGISDQALGQIAPEETPHVALTRRFAIGDQAARGHLAAAGIDFDMQSRPARRLSGGQQARLAMLILRLTHPSLYLLDEPTNHLDIEGQEALERELCADGAAALIVSHDRAFVRAVGTRFWVIGARGLDEIADPEPFFEAALGAG